jgi:hypothetical protein
MIATERSWIKTGIAFVLLSGCRPVAHPAALSGKALGCFEIETSAPLSSALPRRIELRASPSPCPHAPGKFLALDPDAPEESKAHGHWSQLPDGSVKILWGADFQGIAADIHSSGDGMVGTAKVVRDVGEDGPPGDLFLKRVACSK